MDGLEEKVAIVPAEATTIGPAVARTLQREMAGAVVAETGGKAERSASIGLRPDALVTKTDLAGS